MTRSLSVAEYQAKNAQLAQQLAEAQAEIAQRDAEIERLRLRDADDEVRSAIERIIDGLEPMHNDEFVDYHLVRAWLENFSGTMFDEVKP